ncbi:MAG: Uncharacterised protein [Flavobacteriaceae bacterium]|nr:MAG: Uncharacterised protein [Flavobacteriaceae bacterium]
MQFKYPELLYALFLLLIPILIHLFQLRRFQKVAFTNVSFLKKVNMQTRKSSQIKKWLVLLLRLLAVAAIVIAFAEPFKASTTALNSAKETTLYIDNSFSMQANGPKGPLLNSALQELLTKIPPKATINWFTNTSSKKGASVQEVKEDFLKLGYTQKQLSAKQVLLKADGFFSKDETSDKRLIYISDFQKNEAFPKVSDRFKVDAVQLTSLLQQNIAIDSAYVVANKTGITQLKVALSAKELSKTTVSVSLYNKDILSSKIAVDFTKQNKQNITFDIDAATGFKGSISLTDTGLSYDNSLYFSINTPAKLKVLSINTANADFLQRLFATQEFEYTTQDANTLNYSLLAQQNCIILNELKNIDTSLSNALKEFSQNGGSVLIIPALDIDITSYNSLLSNLNLGSFERQLVQQKKISNIVFEHPLYSDVFEKRITNFQYPTINSFYTITSKAPTLLGFEDDKPFLLGFKNNYIATAAFNTQNSNFISSTLIVPTLYNIARQSLETPKLYYTIASSVSFGVAAKLTEDEILNIKDSIVNFIPLQKVKANKVIITTNAYPKSAGTFSINKADEFIESVSYNYNRDETSGIYGDVNNWNGVTPHQNITSLFDAILKENTITDFWKWFALLALIFLIAEMLVLKFYKN